jgi:hypothetical protein
MARKRKRDTERKSWGWGERAWREVWANTARRRRDRESADEGVTAADSLSRSHRTGTSRMRRSHPRREHGSMEEAWVAGRS